MYHHSMKERDAVDAGPAAWTVETVKQYRNQCCLGLEFCDTVSRLAVEQSLIKSYFAMPYKNAIARPGARSTSENASVFNIHS